MVMIKPAGKAGKISKAVMKGKGLKSASIGSKNEKIKMKGPYLQHQDCMDKLIKKVKKDLDKGERDVKVLKKADKKFDRKLAKCDMKMKKKK